MRTFLYNLIEDLLVLFVAVLLCLFFILWFLIIFPLTRIVTYSTIVIMKIRQGFTYSIALLFNRNKDK